MSTDCENARDELARANTRLAEEESSEERARQAKWSAEKAVDQAYSARTRATDALRGHEEKEADRRATLEATREKLIDARSNYDASNRDAYIQGLEEQEREQRWALEDAKESTRKAQREFDECEREEEAARRALNDAVDALNTAERELGKAFDWVDQAKGKVERACND